MAFDSRQRRGPVDRFGGAEAAGVADRKRAGSKQSVGSAWKRDGDRDGNGNRKRNGHGNQHGNQHFDQYRNRHRDKYGHGNRRAARGQFRGHAKAERQYHSAARRVWANGGGSERSALLGSRHDVGTAESDRQRSAGDGSVAGSTVNGAAVSGTTTARSTKRDATVSWPTDPGAAISGSDRHVAGRIST